MMGRAAIVAFAIGLSGCAGLEPAGRNADRSPRAPAPAQTEAPAPTPAPAQTLAPPPQQPPAPTPAPAQQAAPPPAAEAESSAPARARSPDDDVVVPGQVQSQVPPPAGDPRTNEERRADIRSWDQCVMQVQNAFDSDPMSPQLTTPEEYCAQSLGMADRTAVPTARQQRRR